MLTPDPSVCLLLRYQCLTWGINKNRHWSTPRTLLSGVPTVLVLVPPRSRVLFRLGMVALYCEKTVRKQGKPTDTLVNM